MKGGAGRCRVDLRSTVSTLHGTAPIAPDAISSAAFPSSASARDDSSGLPVTESKSRAVAILRPPMRVSTAANSRSPAASDARARQYSDTRKRRRSSSRSTTSRSATLCTRPALSLVRTFFQRTGDRL